VTVRPDVIAAILAMGVVAYACRAGGFFMMRYVPLTPPVQAWLKAIPMSIVGAILGPIAINGGVAEWVGLAAAVGLMWITGRDFVGLFGGIAAVALVRWLLGPG
jgi:uncharacterized membrane protein